MTISTSDSRESYNGNDATTVFGYNFIVFEASDLKVYRIDSEGVRTKLGLGVDYTVTGVGNREGGTVTYPVSGDPLPSGEMLTISRIVEITQETDLRNQGAYYPEVVEREFDNSRMIDQQQQSLIDRSLQLADNSESWDAQGSRISNVGSPVDSSDAATQGYVTGAVASEASLRLAADTAERSQRQAADANLQAQISGSEPLEASAFSEISWHGQQVSSSVIIPENVNAWSFGPVMTIAAGQSVTISSGAFWTIANGDIQ